MEPDRATQSPLCRGQTFQFFFNIISSLCFRKGNSVCIQRSIGCTYFCNMTVFAVAYKCEETENPQVPREVFSEGDNDLKKHYAETNKHELTYTRDSLPLMDKLPDKSWHLLTPRHIFQSLMKMPQTKVAFQVALPTLPLVYQFSDHVTACFFLFITDGQDPVNICPDTPHQMFSTSDENVNFCTREGTTVRENWICFFCFSVSLYLKLPNKYLCVCACVCTCMCNWWFWPVCRIIQWQNNCNGRLNKPITLAHCFWHTHTHTQDSTVTRSDFRVPNDLLYTPRESAESERSE